MELEISRSGGFKSKGKESPRLEVSRSKSPRL